MNKARNRFILLTELIIILLLSLLLTVINVLNFTMAADDADFLTAQIAQRHGVLDPSQNPEPENTEADAQKQGISDNPQTKKPFRLDNGRFGSMGPNSPEMNSSLRYFTFAFDKEDKASVVEFRMSSVSQTEAEEWARSLLGGTTGWTNVSYRYRVYQDGKQTFVTVIDQSRELWPSYRILIISLVGGGIFIILSFVLAHIIGRKLFKPLEEADRKQKLFIAQLENEFKMPLTIINADTETLERQSGTNLQTQSINKQVKRMTRLVKDLGTLSLFEETESKTKTDISDLLTAMLENSRSAFSERNLTLTHTIEPNITLNIIDETAQKLLRELIDNALHFSVSQASFTLQKHNDRIKLIQSNDTTLPNGNYDQIFDRFVRLDNAANISGTGLGLAYVKSIMQSHNGRLSAVVKNGTMIITLDL